MQSQEYLSLSRKYRPMSFEDVNGHEVVITILKNQIASKKLANAYLFTGLHGTGKTTLARIFAKSLNCDDKNNVNPCNKCPSCKKITASSSLDVLEIDGASNRGIDDIRNINETVGYATFDGKYKIYIIDEVHMLTKEAFNALLKTLEEPPKNTKFFFATTEAHKIPATILSRCQKIELKRLPLTEIKEKLQKISENLQLNISDDALSIIARYAEGSMRDGESILENIIAYKKEQVKAEDIYEILNICPKSTFFAIDAAYAKNDLTAPFSLSEKLYASHTNLHSLVDQLCMHFRLHGLSILGQSNEESSLFTKEEQDGYKHSKDIYTMEQILDILTILANLYHYNYPAISKKIHVEILLQKILGTKFAKSSRDILQHLQSLKDVQLSPPKNSVKESVTTAKKEVIQQSSTAQPLPNQSPPQKKEAPEEIATFKKEDLSQQNKIDTVVQFATVELGATLTKNPEG